MNEDMEFLVVELAALKALVKALVVDSLMEMDDPAAAATMLTNRAFEAQARFSDPAVPERMVTRLTETVASLIEEAARLALARKAQGRSQS